VAFARLGGGRGRLVSAHEHRVTSESLITPRSTPPSPLLAGRYRLDAVLGHGAASTVHRAWDRITAHWVAVKTFPVEGRLGTERARHFERELESVRRLDHPHIVRLLDFGTTREGSFLVMQLVEGGPLERTLGASHPRVESVATWFDQVLRALEHAHGRGVVHCDIKPSNILLERRSEDETPFALVCDFGLSTTLTRIESWAGEPIAGTPRYMAPEQALGESVDGQTDVYAIGAVLFTCLAGRPPFEEHRAIDVLRAHVGRPAPDLGAIRPDLPRNLVDLVHWMLEKDRARRCPSALAARDALRAASTRRSAPASRIEVALPELDLTPRRAHEPPWPGAPPYERYVASSAGRTLPPAPASADEATLSRMWSRHERVTGDVPSGPSFWVRTSEGLILGPLDWPDLTRVLERERRSTLAPEVWLSTDRRSWTSLETFAAWTEQPHLAPGLGAAETEPATLSHLFREAGRRTSERATGRLAVRLKDRGGATTWRAFLKDGAVVRFELADPTRSLPELVRTSRERSSLELARDAARCLEERTSLWELWTQDRLPFARGLRMRMLRIACQALLKARITSMAWTDGEPPWRGPPVAPSLLALLLYAAQTGQPRTRWLRALEPYMGSQPEPTVALVEGLEHLAPDEDALGALRQLLGASTLGEALETGAEPSVVYTGVASRWVRLVPREDLSQQSVPERRDLSPSAPRSSPPRSGFDGTAFAGASKSARSIRSARATSKSPSGAASDASTPPRKADSIASTDRALARSHGSSGDSSGGLIARPSSHTGENRHG